MIVKGKGELARYLADAMFSSYARYRSEQKLEQDTGLLKSYFIEAHVANNDGKNSHDTILEFLGQISGDIRIVVEESLPLVLEESCLPN